MSDTIDGEIIGISYPLAEDKLKNIKWKTAEGEIIPIGMITNSHLRNIALFLMGMGYKTCIAPDSDRLNWLVVLRMEWERRKRTGTSVVKVSNSELMRH